MFPNDLEELDRLVAIFCPENKIGLAPMLRISSSVDRYSQ